MERLENQARVFHMNNWERWGPYIIKLVKWWNETDQAVQSDFFTTSEAK